jgi:hypothetical protein
MGACLIGYSNLADIATLSGGDWLATMPRDNLLTDPIGLHARTVDDATASTQFDIDFGGAQGVRLFALVSHNLSASATYRLRGSDTAGVFTTPLYDSGTTSAWAASYTASAEPWESDGFWDSIVTWSGADGGTPNLIHVLAAETAARYWRLEIADTTNADGYVEAGRLFVGPAFAPAVNFDWGAAIGYADESTVEMVYGGTEYFDRRPVRRVATLRFSWLTDAEALRYLLDLQRTRGITREILFVWDPDDLEYFQRRSFLARQQDLNPIEAARYGAHSAALRLRELI